MPFHIGPTELIVVLAIVMMIFGIGKLPQAGRSIGKGFREFRKAQSEVQDIKNSLDITKDLKEDSKEPNEKSDDAGTRPTHE